MTYHANHSICHHSCWNNKGFYAEVMVYFGDTLTKTELKEYVNVHIK